MQIRKSSSDLLAGVISGSLLSRPRALTGTPVAPSTLSGTRGPPPPRWPPLCAAPDLGADMAAGAGMAAGKCRCLALASGHASRVERYRSWFPRGHELNRQL